MNLSNDYFMRMIESIVVALAKIFFMKDNNSKEEVNIEINKLSLERIGLEINKIEELDTYEIIDILYRNALTFEENCQVVAELLYVRGDMYSKENDTNNAYNCYLKSLEIYLYLSKEGTYNFIFDAGERIDELESKLGQYVLPIETEILLFNYKFKCGQYSKAEDILFSLLEADKSNRIFELGFNFYNQLLIKKDDDLIANGFSRDEIHQGIDELNKLKGKCMEDI